MTILVLAARVIHYQIFYLVFCPLDEVPLDLVGDKGHRAVLSPWGNTAAADQNMQMRVVVAGSPEGLQDHDQTDVELNSGRGAEDIFPTGVTGLHELAEERRILIEPNV